MFLLSQIRKLRLKRISLRSFNMLVRKVLLGFFLGLLVCLIVLKRGYTHVEVFSIDNGNFY